MDAIVSLAFGEPLFWRLIGHVRDMSDSMVALE